MVINWFKRQLGLIVEIPRGWELMQLPAERIAELRVGYPPYNRDKPLSSCPAYLDVDLFARAVWPPLDGKYRVYLVREGEPTILPTRDAALSQPRGASVVVDGVDAPRPQ